ncbi:GTPase HflX [Proteinivorax hydrogeniformans]|uniref:GTPase HflX n=1 Tax=Proteinivorax hydrogeniformans TaxID=1826727 RepID=A0AAU8HVL1_9FIRM
MEQTKKAILVGVNLKNNPNFQYSMEELANLADACGIVVMGEVIQNLDHINASHYVGKGKVKDIYQTVQQEEADLVIFNNELSPSQIRNLEEGLNSTIMDRTSLILDIFYQRAKTKEAKLQVEIAQLQYMLPRLRNSELSLEQQRGGTGTIMRGAGETKLELDRRKIQKQISELNKQLKDLVARRQTQRKQRQKSNVPVISLVGYTNAGKSTVMNSLLETYNPEAEKSVYEEDMLFATLRTSVRSITLFDNKSFLLTDTVGFVSDLPHHLVKAFRSTLEEVTESDLLVHVVDYSNPNYERQIEVTNSTLRDIGVKDIPVVYAYNKCDLTDLEIPKLNGNKVYFSAKERLGLEELVQLINSKIFADQVKCELLVPFDRGDVVSYFNEKANVLDTGYEKEGTKLKVECTKADLEKYKEFVI